MKNKKLTQIILGVFVLGVWGTIFYKIYTKLTDEDEATPVADIGGPVTTKQIGQDTFRLLANYDDPFSKGSFGAVSYSGGSSGGSRHAAVAPSSIPPKPVIKAEPVVAPAVQLRFLGMVNNNATKKKVAMISINGQTNLMQENQQIDNIKLLKIFPDSALVLINKKKLAVRR